MLRRARPAASPAAPPRVTTVALPSLDEVVDRLGDVRDRIAAAAGGSNGVKIVAVTKGFGPPLVSTAVKAGLTELGENYAQELVSKAIGAPAGVRWHFLGALQRRRVPALMPHVAVWETIDRPEAADVVAARAPGAATFVQVNIVGDPGKLGCAPGETEGLVAHCRGLGLDVRGLMVVGPNTDRPATRRCFSDLALMADDLGLAELSMGMSDDYEIAVAEGATNVRLGRVLFGPRPSARRPQG